MGGGEHTMKGGVSFLIISLIVVVGSDLSGVHVQLLQLLVQALQVGVVEELFIDRQITYKGRANGLTNISRL